MKKPKGKHVIDFDALDVVVIGRTEYTRLKHYERQYWATIKKLRPLIPARPTYNVSEWLGLK